MVDHFMIGLTLKRDNPFGLVFRSDVPHKTQIPSKAQNKVCRKPCNPHTLWNMVPRMRRASFKKHNQSLGCVARLSASLDILRDKEFLQQYQKTLFTLLLKFLNYSCTTTQAMGYTHEGLPTQDRDLKPFNRLFSPSI